MENKTIYLDYGSHDPHEGKYCLLEAAAHLAGEQHTDRPKCVCPVLAAVGRGLNDLLDADRRQVLLAGLAPALVGTFDPALAKQRSLEWADWCTRVFLPTWLDITPSLAPHAEILRSLPPMTEDNTDGARIAVYGAYSAATAAAHPRGLDGMRNIASRSAYHTAWGAAWVASRHGGIGEFSAADAVIAAALATTDGSASIVESTIKTLQESAVALLRRQCGL